MDKVLRTAVTTAAIAIAALSLALPAQAGPRSVVGAGLVGFGIGAILGSMMGPPEVYFVPPPPAITDLWSMGRPITTDRWPTGPLTLTGRGPTGPQTPTGLGAMDRRLLTAMAIASIQVPRRRLPATKSGALRPCVQRRQRRAPPRSRRSSKIRMPSSRPCKQRQSASVSNSSPKRTSRV